MLISGGTTTTRIALREGGALVFGRDTGRADLNVFSTHSAKARVISSGLNAGRAVIAPELIACNNLWQIPSTEGSKRFSLRLSSSKSSSPPLPELARNGIFACRHSMITLGLLSS